MLSKHVVLIMQIINIIINIDDIGQETPNEGPILKLRILTRNEHPKIKLQRLRKMRIWMFGTLVHQINSF